VLNLQRLPGKEVSVMGISYKKLWKLLIDRDMKKKDLQKLSGVSSASITKLGKNENVNTDILGKICKSLKCDVADIMEVIDDDNR
jgi:putative transcriptional regulator